MYRALTTQLPKGWTAWHSLRVGAEKTTTALEDRVALEIEKALGEGARPRDIAVLSLAGQSRTALCAGAHIGRVTVTRADAADADTNVVADTFLRFKGLERPRIIVAERSPGDMRARPLRRPHAHRADTGDARVRDGGDGGGDRGGRPTRGDGRRALSLPRFNAEHVWSAVLRGRAVASIHSTRQANRESHPREACHRKIG